MWQFAPNSIYYLLSLWQRMVMSIPYVKASEPHMLETYTPEVCIIEFNNLLYFYLTSTILLASVTYHVYTIQKGYLKGSPHF